ncbi:MAG TPA: helix-turn-helix domain-containing protein [Mycobacteriales bacterium]|nr:helix-turn-helix domain-containing protein [Mycobacteriales bacterium]
MVAAAQLHRVAAAASREAGGVPVELLGDYLAIVVDAAATGRRLTAAELSACRDRGADAARAQVALRELVDLYLSATWRLWRLLPTSRSGGVRDLGEAVLRAADDAVASATDGYQQARRALVRHEITDRREFVDDLLSGRADVAGMVERAERHGLNLAGQHTVSVVVSRDPITDASPVIARLERALSTAQISALVASKEGRLVCVAADDTDRVTAALTRTVRSGAGTRIGIGRAYAGPAGVLRSYDEACNALEVAARLELPGPAARAADLLVYQVLGRDRAALVDLVRAVLEPLTRARDGAEPLLHTLDVYFASAAVAAEAARRLHLSVRAVTYRLARVRALTDHDADDPAQRYTLQTAVLGARLLDWPAEPLPDQT